MDSSKSLRKARPKDPTLATTPIVAIIPADNGYRVGGVDDGVGLDLDDVISDDGKGHSLLSSLLHIGAIIP